jgi:hypothetical protein
VRSGGCGPARCGPARRCGTESAVDLSEIRMPSPGDDRLSVQQLMQKPSTKT